MTAPNTGGGVNGLLAISQVQDDQGVTLMVAGELDISSAPRLREALSELGGQPSERVLIDLSGLTFMDSTGLACLIAADRDARVEGQRLQLRGIHGQVQMLFELTGLTERFNLER